KDLAGLRVSLILEAVSVMISSSFVQDTERNGPDTNHQTQQSKPSPFSASPTSTGTKIKAEDPTEMPPAPAPAPAPAAQQPHLPQAQLMLAGSQLAGVSGGGTVDRERNRSSVGVLWMWVT
uniref:Uncharacterized protein n=1 Tax=Varanus komodoensis TaxID=61221 RepID=A0A8D2KUR5_VARKO